MLADMGTGVASHLPHTHSLKPAMAPRPLLSSICSSATVATRKNPKHGGEVESMGFGFVEYKRRADAMKALSQLQGRKLEGHKLELTMTNRNKAKREVTQGRLKFGSTACGKTCHGGGLSVSSVRCGRMCHKTVTREAYARAPFLHAPPQ